jgi:hypothetical protein
MNSRLGEALILPLPLHTPANEKTGRQQSSAFGICRPGG